LSRHRSLATAASMFLQGLDTD